TRGVAGSDPLHPERLLLQADPALGWRALALPYVAFVGVPLAGLLVVVQLGPRLVRGAGAPAPRAPPPPAARARPDLLVLLPQIVVVLVASRAMGLGMRLLRQPQVVGEMAAGIALGPSVLGAWFPHAAAALFPPASLGFLNALSQIGLLL